MIKKVYLILFLIFPFSIYGQVTIRGGMGINFQNTPSFNDYINENFASYGSELNNFNSAVMFSVEGGYLLNQSNEIALELDYLLYSYTYSYTLGQYEFFYGIIMPSILDYYVIQGEGYQLKFGGGAGVRFVIADQTLPGSTSSVKYNSTGFGIILKADGNTRLDGNFYANIGVDARYDWNGEPEHDGSKLYNDASMENVNLNALSFGIHLGIAFIF